MSTRQYLLFALIISVVTVQANASGDKLDSLRQVITSNNSQEEVVDAMNDMAKEFKKRYKSDSIKYYADSALKISTKDHYIKGIASSTITLCNYYWSNGQGDKALAIIPALMYWANKLDDKEILGKAYYNAGVTYGMNGNLDSAIYFFKASLAENLDDSSTILLDYNGLGNIYRNIGDNDSAFFYHFKAARVAEMTGDNKNLSLIYSNIGSGYNSVGQYDEAEKYVRKGLELARKNKFYKTVADDLSRLSAVYYDRKEYVEALNYLDSASAILDSIGSYSRRSDIYRRYGMIHEDMGKSELALGYYLKAYVNCKREIDQEGMIMTLQNIAWVYAAMGKYDMARANLDSGLNIARSKGYQSLQMMLLNSRAEVSYDKGDYKQAYDEYHAYFHLYDTIHDIEKTKFINELKQKYEKEQDQAQILSLEKETLKKTLQRNLILFNSSALVVAAMFLLMLLRHKLIKTKLISQQKIHKLEEEKKIMLARNLVEGQEAERKRIAMELHDGLGVILSAVKMHITSINDDIPKGNPIIKKAIQMLDQANGEVRRISHNMMPGLLTKMGLYEAVEDLIDNINEMDNIQAVIEIDGERVRLPENSEIMIYRIIQEMINNTLKYARASRIDMTVNISDSVMIINYKDDGVGFDTDEKLKSGAKSLGLKSIESRVVFLNGMLKLESSPGEGVEYWITVPI